MKSLTLLSQNLKTAVLVGVCAFALSHAQAHNVWIEDAPGKGVMVRFAEWPDEYEETPGHLDELSLPVAWSVDAKGQPIACKVEKKSDGFLLEGVTGTNSLQLETEFDVMTSTNGPARKPIFYARWQPAGAGAAKPNMNFDIVPTANAGEYQVFLRGEPLAGVKVTAHLPKGKDQSLTADGKGIVHFSADKPGLYMLSCAHQRETTKGFSAGVFYDQVSHNCAITWRQ